MAKQAPQQNDDGPRLYVVLERKSPTELKQLGVVRARNADRARHKFLDFDPKTLVGVPANRWNENEGMCLENEPKLKVGESVPVIEGQLAMDAA